MRLWGKYRGFVVDRDDPKRLKRLRVRIPSLLGPYPTSWAWPCVSDWHSLRIPPVGAGVWVEFEGGDPSKPIWTGVWWGAPDDEPETPAEALEGYPDIDEWSSASGFHLIIDNRDDKERLLIRDPVKGLQVLLDRAAGVVEISDGTNHIIMDGETIRARERDGRALKLLDERFLPIFNNHVHPYTWTDPGGSGNTEPPTTPGKVDEHTTTVFRGG